MTRRTGRRLGRFAAAALLALLGLAGCSGGAPAAVRAPLAGAAPLPPSVAPTPPARPFPNEAAIDAYLSGLAARDELSGSVLIARNGMLFSGAYGTADRRDGEPNTPQTMFRLGSVTKQFTAMAILILQQRHLLRTTDGVCRYVPSCPEDWRSISIWNLLTHTSGIPDYINVPDLTSWWTKPQTPAQLLARFEDLPLDFRPGSIMRYSNSNYALLGWIIERVSGQPYATFLQSAIFGQLGMTSTGFDVAQIRPGHAQGYYRDYVTPDRYDPSVLYAAGGLYSSAQDMLTWDRALTADTLVPRAAMTDMFTAHVRCPPAGSQDGCLLPTDIGYGFGWFVANEPQGRLEYHVGHIDGFFSFNGIYTQRGLDVVVLSNLETTDVLGIGRKLAAMV